MSSRIRKVLGTLALVGCLVGCAPVPSMNCTEVGWSNAIDVVGSGAGLSAVADVRLCVGDRCSLASDVAGDAEARAFFRAHNTGGPWRIDIGMELPRRVQVTTLDGAGAELSSAEFDVDWPGITEPNGPGCGERADPAELRIEVPLPDPAG